MIEKHSGPQSRRSVLAASLGAVGALVANRLTAPDAAAAADGGNALLGTANTSTVVTSFENTDAGETSLQGIATSGAGVVGTATNGTGMSGSAVAGAGVLGQSGTGNGVEAYSADFMALYAHSGTGAGAAIVGPQFGLDSQCIPVAPTSDFSQPSHHTGVVASAGDRSAMTNNTDETGVYGFSNVSANSTGVWGDSGQGVGIAGTGDWGVFGSGTIGVYAHAATSEYHGLYTTGKIHFAGRSGRKSITKGHQYVDIAVTAMTTSSAVIATLQTYKSGYYIAAAISYSGKFRLYLNKAAVGTMYFSYLVTD